MTAGSMKGKTMLRRRDFLAGCGAVAATAALSAATAQAASPAPAATVSRFSRTLRKQEFLALVDEPVRIRRSDGGTVRARVVEVRDGLRARRLEQFTVFLRAPRGAALTPGLYTVEHRAAGAVQLFLEPARAGRWSAYYRANFSLLV